jgi:quinol-cytochrome oxidoreductase complex cytochrome b subunit
MFFGFCGLVVLLIPFLDRGPRSRQFLNALVAFSVVFFIVMTAWGWFSRPTDGTLRIILACILTFIVLPLLLPFTQPRTTARQAVYASLALAGVVLFAASWWELLG